MMLHYDVEMMIHDSANAPDNSYVPKHSVYLILDEDLLMLFREQFDDLTLIVLIDTLQFSELYYVGGGL
jgi:hypothetical protein